MKNKIFPYYQAVPEIFIYQAVSKFVLGVLLGLLHAMAMWALKSTGRVAISSGDYKFIFGTWQGAVLIMLGICTVFVYVALDLNMKIILSSKLLNKEQIFIRQILKESFFSLKKMLSINGIGVVLYVTLLAPILGVGVSVSLTKGLYIPTFISSVINATPLYNILYSVFALVFTFIGLANIFVLHSVALDHLSVKEAQAQSKGLMKKHWKNYLKENFLYSLTIMLGIGIIVAFVLVVLFAMKQVMILNASIGRFTTLLACIVLSIAISFLGLMITPFYLMKMTQLYYSYKEQKKEFYEVRKRRKHPFIKAAVLVVLVISILSAALVTRYFDEVFSDKGNVEIIAHRGGGIEGAENTVAGLLRAYELGAKGSEIDIQRTLDGAYVVNHDTNFQRTANVNKTPGEMTLEEVKELSVDGEPVATLEEMLSASKDRLILFVELKGSSADRQMAEDAIMLIKEYGMESQAVVISLKYDLIDYIETTYPEMLTGYLTFVSFGDTAGLNCDYLGLEEESATSDAIDAIHQQGKKAIVWTANERGSQKHFLLSQADYLITDNVEQAMEVMQEIKERDDFTKIIDTVLSE